MSKGSAPSPPDPAETAAAQADANRQAVRESAKVNQIGINSPWGRQFYTGTIGKPDRALNIELTPGGERTRLAQERLSELLSGYGAETLGPAALERLGMPDADVGGQIYERSIARREPGFERQEDRLHSRLTSQGIPPGSRAYEQAMGELREAEDFARTDLALGADLQGLSENRAQRSQAINELAALLQGSPAIGSPATQMPAQYQVAPPDISGLTMANYAGRLNQYNTQAQQLGGMYGALGQLGAAGISAAFPPAAPAMSPIIFQGSDRRLKTDVEFIGIHDGQRWYTYRYLWETVRRLGVMAQEVLETRPDAVFEMPGGYFGVDYGRLVPGLVLEASIDCVGIERGVVGPGSGPGIGRVGHGGGSLSGSLGMQSIGLHDCRIELQRAIAVGFGARDETKLLALLSDIYGSTTGGEGKSDKAQDDDVSHGLLKVGI